MLKYTHFSLILRETQKYYKIPLFTSKMCKSSKTVGEQTLSHPAK